VRGSGHPNDTEPPVGRRHLIYYILPVAGNGVWQKGVDALRLRWGLFTGKKIVAIARGEPITEQLTVSEMKAGDKTVATRPLDDLETVRAYLPPDCEVIEVDNDPMRWEHVAWERLWARVLEGADGMDAVLYCHAKGVTRPAWSAAHRWADLLYTLALDYWPETEALLRKGPIAGSLVKYGNFFSAPSNIGKWHYSGNFFWMRASTAREKLATVPVPADRWGAEAWIGIAFPIEQCGELFGPRNLDMSLYFDDHMDKVLEDFTAWSTHHRPSPVVVPPVVVPPVYERFCNGVRLSVVVPTAGRPSLQRTLASFLSQLHPHDEVIIENDKSGDWGMTPRTRGQRAATGDYLMWMDDDDVYLPGAFDAVRAALKENPGRPHLFSMKRSVPFNDVLPKVREIKVGNVSTQMLVVPNDPSRLGEWSSRYEGDFDFIASTLNKYPPEALVWHDAVLSVWRPDGDATTVASLPRTIHQFWTGPKDMPPVFEKWAEKWRELNPDWTYKLWTEAEVAALDPEIGRAMREVPYGLEQPAAKSDLARVAIVLCRGGLWVSSDVEPVKPLGTVLDGVSVFRITDNTDRPVCVFGAVPDHAWMRTARGTILSRRAHALPPPAVRRVIGVTGDALGVFALPTRFFQPYPWIVREFLYKPASTWPDAYAIHRHAGSWRADMIMPLFRTFKNRF